MLPLLQKQGGLNFPFAAADLFWLSGEFYGTVVGWAVNHIAPLTVSSLGEIEVCPKSLRDLEML